MNTGKRDRIYGPCAFLNAGGGQEHDGGEIRLSSVFGSQLSQFGKFINCFTGTSRWTLVRRFKDYIVISMYYQTESQKKRHSAALCPVRFGIQRFLVI